MPTHTDSPSRGYVLALGDANMDITGTPSVQMRPCAAHPGAIRAKRGGCARNAAENLARLGCDSRLLSVFGDDANGRALLQATAAAGVDLAASLVLPATPSSTSLIVYDAEGELFCSVGDIGIVGQLTPERLHAQAALIRGAELIVANTVLSVDALSWLFNHCGDRPLFIDTVDGFLAPRILPWLACVDTLKPNRAEASQLSGLPFGSREHAAPIADWFHHAGVRRVVLSLGQYGLYYSDGDLAGWLPPLPVDVVNVSGAGDALMAGLAYGRLEGMAFADSVRFGLGCAALTLGGEDNNHPALSPSAVRLLLQRAATPRTGAPGA